MKINDVVIENWKPPVESWWDNVEQKPDEPLIEATMNLTLSWNEYLRLLQIEQSVCDMGALRLRAVD